MVLPSAHVQKAVNGYIYMVRTGLIFDRYRVNVALWHCQNLQPLKGTAVCNVKSVCNV